MDLFFIIFLLAVIIAVGYYWYEEKRYKETEYYNQTKNDYFSVKTDKGLAGEFSTWDRLKDLPGYHKSLFNCYVPKKNKGTTEIDFILLHETGIYIFESKNYGGWIYGSENQKYWLQTLPMGKKGIQRNKLFNPVIQNKIHMRWLARYVDFKPAFFYTYVVFSDRCRLKKVFMDNERHKVVYMSNLFSAVKKQIALSETRLTKDEIDSLYKKLEPLTQVDEEEKRRHVENIRENLEPLKLSYVQANIKSLRCPSCDSVLVIRRAKRGKNAGRIFLGCSNYPECKYTRDVVNDLQHFKSMKWKRIHA